MSAVAAARRWSSRAMALIAWARALAYRDPLTRCRPSGVPSTSCSRWGSLDRAVVIAAQALFGLVPLVVVLAAYLPDALHQGLDRFEAVTGLSSSRVAAVPVDTHLADKIGLVGLLITVVSASSFARAVMRMYAHVWQIHPEKGIRGRGRALAWLGCWLVLLQVVSTVVQGLSRALSGVPDLPAAVVALLVQVVFSIGMWAWSIHFLLNGRIPLRRSWVAAVLTGVAATLVAAGSRVVMPHYTASSAQQFGSFGLVLAVAAWLVIFAEVIVVAAVIGRVLNEDDWTRRWLSIVLGPLPLVGELGFLRAGAGLDLDDQQHDRRDDEKHERPRSSGVVGQDVDEDDDTSD